MDHSLSPDGVDLSRILLSLSPEFESYLSSSPNPMWQGLQLLQTLGEITRLSFEKPLTVESLPPKITPSTAGAPGRAPVQPKIERRLTLKEKQTLEALLKVRGTDHSLRRGPGIFTSILRPDQT